MTRKPEHNTKVFTLVLVYTVNERNAYTQEEIVLHPLELRSNLYDREALSAIPEQSSSAASTRAHSVVEGGK